MIENLRQFSNKPTINLYNIFMKKTLYFTKQNKKQMRRMLCFDFL